jgi:predicted PP-loop superfamily ATPase
VIHKLDVYLKSSCVYVFVKKEYCVASALASGQLHACGTCNMFIFCEDIKYGRIKCHIEEAT